MIQPFLLTFARPSEYFDTISLIKRIKKSKIDIKIVVMWINPKSEDQWVFDFLSQRNYIHDVIKIENYEDTDHSKSLSINFGLEYISNLYHNSYILYQDARIVLPNSTYYNIKEDIESGYSLICYESDLYGHYATDVFAVVNDRSYWPVVADEYGINIVDREWFLKVRSLPNKKVIKC